MEISYLPFAPERDLFAYFLSSPAKVRELTTEETEMGFTGAKSGRIHFVTRRSTYWGFGPYAYEERRSSSLPYTCFIKTHDMNRIAVAIFDHLAIIADRTRSPTGSSTESPRFLVTNFRLTMPYPRQRLWGPEGTEVRSPELASEVMFTTRHAPELRQVESFYSGIVRLVITALSEAEREQDKSCSLRMTTLVRRVSPMSYDVSLDVLPSPEDLRANASGDPRSNVFLRAAEILDPDGRYTITEEP